MYCLSGATHQAPNLLEIEQSIAFIASLIMLVFCAHFLNMKAKDIHLLSFDQCGENISTCLPGCVCSYSISSVFYLNRYITSFLSVFLSLKNLCTSLLIISTLVIPHTGREPPVIQIYPKVQQTIVVGASTLFQCHLTSGIPTPTVRWSRADGRPMTSNTETLNGGVLRFVVPPYHNIIL